MTALVDRDRARPVRSRTRCGTARPACLRKVVPNRHDRATWRIAVPALSWSGAGESPAPSSVPPRQRRHVAQRGGGDSPPPLALWRHRHGDLRSASRRCRRLGGTGRLDRTRRAVTARTSTRRRCAWSEPMSTADFGPASATPNWSKPVRDNGRQPVTTNAEDSSGRVSPCDRAGGRAHRKPIKDRTIDTEVTGDNR